MSWSWRDYHRAFAQAGAPGCRCGACRLREGRTAEAVMLDRVEFADDDVVIGPAPAPRFYSQAEFQ